MRRELPIERGFNEVKGPEGLSTTALFDFLKGRVEHPDDTPEMRERDRNYHASEYVVAVVTIDEKKYHIRINDAGFSCISPTLYLHGEVDFEVGNYS